MIGRQAFCECSSLRNINFPSTLEVIGDWAFYKCPRIVSAEFNETGLKEIGDSAFFFCTSLERATIPSTVRRIGEEAFKCCKELEMLTLYDGLRIIGRGAFSGCKSFKYATIPETVVRIEESVSRTFLPSSGRHRETTCF